MAKYCGACGAALEEDARFCGACGAPMEHEAPRLAAADKAKKPLPRWAKPALLVGAAAVVALGLLSAGLKAANAPEKIVQKFLAAAENGDFSALRRVSVVQGADWDLTDESTAPFFRLCRENASFYHEMTASLTDDAARLEKGRKAQSSGAITLVAQPAFLHTAYRVEFAPCDAEVVSELATADISCAGQNVTAIATAATAATAGTDAAAPAPENDDYDVYATAYNNGEGGTATLMGLLPGKYDLVGVYDAEYGDNLAGSGVLEVTDVFTNSASVEFDFVCPNVFNDSTVVVTVWIDGAAQLTVPAGADGYLAPMHPDTQIELRADVAMDTPLTQQFIASDAYLYTSFKLCNVRVFNDLDAPVTVYRAQALISTIPPNTSVSLQTMPSGTQFQVRLLADEKAYRYFTYTCEHEKDYITASYELMPAALKEIETVIGTYVTAVENSYNKGDSAALAAMVTTAFCGNMMDDLAERKAYNESRTLGSFVLTYDKQDQPTSDGKAVEVNISYKIELNWAGNVAGEQTVDGGAVTSSFFRMRYENATWTVVNDVNATYD